MPTTVKGTSVSDLISQRNRPTPTTSQPHQPPLSKKFRTPTKDEVYKGATLYDLAYNPPLAFNVSCNCPSKPVRHTLHFVSNHLHLFGIPINPTPQSETYDDSNR